MLVAQVVIVLILSFLAFPQRQPTFRYSTWMPARSTYAGCLQSITINFDNSCGEILRGFLRKIVPDATLDDPMCIFAREFFGIGTGVRVWRTVGVTFKGNGRHGDGGRFRKPLVQMEILRFAVSQAEPPAVVMDDDRHVIRVIEGRRASSERGIVEVPFRRGELPNQLRKVASVFVVASPAALRGKIVLVPPLQFSLWRQWCLADSWLPIR